MTFSTTQLIPAILWTAPAVQTLATLAFIALCYNLRRNLGAHNMHVGILLAFAAIVLALHVGYFLAPLWWKSGRCLLGAATMLPTALIVLGTIVVTATQTDIVPALGRAALPLRIAAFSAAGLLFLAYLGPLVLMLAASS